jgi:hypothetical protein
LGNPGLRELRHTRQRHDGHVISEAEYRRQVAEAFDWLVGRGFGVEVTAYGALAHSALLTDRRRWLRVVFETQEGAIFLSWGDYMGPGTFNDDPLRNPKPLRDLLPDLTMHDLEAAGAVAGDNEEHVRTALLRLSRLLERDPTDRLSGGPVK